MQRQRVRAKGVTLDPSAIGGSGKDEAAEDAEEAAGDGGLDSTFTTQADSGEIDHNMLKYIEEQMHGEGGASGDASGNAAADVALSAEEAELYVPPAHLIGVLPNGAAPTETEDSANRWLAGIMEVPLSTEDKIATIEETELAKRAMMDRIGTKTSRYEQDKSRDGHKLVAPGNYNSNFHQHRRENAIARREQFGGKGAGKGGGKGGGQKGIASDASVMGRFRAQERRKGR